MPNFNVELINFNFNFKKIILYSMKIVSLIQSEGFPVN